MCPVKNSAPRETNLKMIDHYPNILEKTETGREEKVNECEQNEIEGEN